MLKELYNSLVKLCDSTEAFDYKDFTSKGNGTYRIFTYRLASYSDFLNPSAFECRGSMFKIDPVTKEFISMASRTPKKFFNAYENPFVMFDKNMLTSEVVLAMDKLDGSIVSTYMDDDNVVRTKSHGSLYSDHAINSSELIKNDAEFYKELTQLCSLGWTTNMEYTSPEYRIVLPYQTDDVTVLNVINIESGEYMSPEELKNNYPVLYNKSVYADGNINSNFPKVEYFEDAVNQIRNMKDIEGFVVQLKDGRMCKIKTDWYCSLHHTKDSITIDSRLFKAVLDGGSDDLRQLFSTDKYAIDKIEKMENLVFSCYNSLVQETQDFAEKYKDLDTKEYAKKVQAELSKELNRQGIAFAIHQNKKVDYKDVLHKYMKVILGENDNT